MNNPKNGNKDIYNYVVQTFPLKTSKLSYEIIAHKKVNEPDIVMAIPEGKRCLSWFTSYNSDNVCFLLELDDNNSIYRVKQLDVGFMDSLSLGLGTVFYGTLFFPNNIRNSCFCIEDIYYYKGKYYNQHPFNIKLHTMANIFKNEIIQMALNNQYTLFGLPLLGDSIDNLLHCISATPLPYKVSTIKYRFVSNSLQTRKIVTMDYEVCQQSHQQSKINVFSKSTNEYKGFIKEAVFKVIPDVEPDIYHLFAWKDNASVYYDVAFIPDYKTSVMMNKLFRNIKENDNLDTVEESDDEEEFQNISHDKYVYLDREYNIRCILNAKFKRWVPQCLAKEGEKIVSVFDLRNNTTNKK